MSLAVLGSAAVSCLTAGLTQGLLGSTGTMNWGTGATQADSGITLSNIGNTAINIGEQSLIGAATQTAIGGGSFGNALLCDLASNAAAVGPLVIVVFGGVPMIRRSDERSDVGDAGRLRRVQENELTIHGIRRKFLSGHDVRQFPLDNFPAPAEDFLQGD